MNNTQSGRPIPLKSLHIPDIGQSSTASTSSTSSASSNATADPGLPGILNASTNETFDQEDITEMNLVFSTSPKLAQIIVEHLKDPTYLNDREYRSAIFSGEPGTGKSMMAKAIGYKMMVEAGWQYKFLSSTQFLEKFRNQTAIRLTQVLHAIKACAKPTILIIDELNRLLEHAESQHHDTDATSAALWTFIDQMHKNGKFFFIGTMNRLTKLPKPYKSRILLEYIEFPALQDPGQKVTIIRSRLTDAITQLAPAVTDQLLETEIQKLGACSQRDLKNLASFVKKLYRKGENTRSHRIVIDLDLIQSAIAEYNRRKTAIKYDEEEKTDAERQDKYHADTMKMQEKHFLQQQLKQDLLSKYSTTVSDDYEVEAWGGKVILPATVQIVDPEGIRRIQELFSPEQQAIIADLQAQTKQRLDRESQEKAQREAAKRQNKGFWLSVFGGKSNAQ